MTRKTKLKKLHDSYNENLQKFGRNYLKYQDFSKKNFSDLYDLDKIDVVVENVQYMSSIIHDAAYAIVSANDYIESLEQKIDPVSKII